MAARVESEQQEQTGFESSISNSDIMTGGSASGSSGSGGNELMRLNEDDEESILLKHKLYSSLKSAAQYCTIIAEYKNMHSSDSAKARLEAFRLYSESMMEKGGRRQNIKFAWYGTSKDEINQIICHGFEICGASEESGLYGLGVYLSPETSAFDSVVSATVNKNGLRHVLFCSVILGNTEKVIPGSRQSQPSSEEFDSGVDNQQFPKKYIVWPAHMKTHILPLYVVSIRLDFSSKGLQKEPVKIPTSPWIPFTALISILSGHLPPPTICLIKRYHNAFVEKKVTWEQLTFVIRQVSGDKLLIAAIKSFRAKVVKAAIISSLKKGKDL